MKKLLFIIFFPITIPLYLIYRFFGWFIDTFIPFLQYDAIPFVQDNVFPLFTDKLFPAIKRLIKSVKEKSAEKEIKETPESITTYSADTQNPTAENDSDINLKSYSNAAENISQTAKKEIEEKPDINTVYSADIQTASNTTVHKNSFSTKIDYEQYPMMEDEGSDPLYIRAMAVAVYEKDINIYTLQRILKIPYGRAYFLLERLLETHFIYSKDERSYSSIFTENYFEKILSDIFENQNSSSQTIQLSKDEIDNLCYKYSYQYSDIDYKKYSKIVSIFTKKWRNVCEKEFIALDFETTGLNYMDDRIIEIAAIKYVNGVETDKFIHLVNPLIPIPYAATRINNITNEMVADADTERYLIPQLIEFLSDSLIVGHNLNFDLHFLEVAAQRYGFNVQYNYIDTLSVSKKLFPELLNYKLTTIAKNLGHDVTGMHRAEEDVRVCAEIIKIALDSME